MSKYSYKPYNPNFPEIALKEIKSLLTHFPQAQAEHFGSSAIPGVGGKGIVDIFLAVEKSQINNTQSQIEKIGYEYKPTGGVDGQRWFFQKDKLIKNTPQRFHLHLTFIGNASFAEALAFRDYLIQNPAIAKEYDLIKQLASQKAQEFDTYDKQKQIYQQTKNPLIDRIIRQIEYKLF